MMPKYYLGIKQKQNSPILEVRIKFIKRKEEEKETFNGITSESTPFYPSFLLFWSTYYVWWTTAKEMKRAPSSTRLPLRDFHLPAHLSNLCKEVIIFLSKYCNLIWSAISAQGNGDEAKLDWGQSLLSLCAHFGLKHKTTCCVLHSWLVRLLQLKILNLVSVLLTFYVLALHAPKENSIYAIATCFALCKEFSPTSLI